MQAGYCVVLWAANNDRHKCVKLVLGHLFNIYGACMIFADNKRIIKLITGVCAAMCVASTATAADHQEAPGATALLSADIGDYYAWHDDTNINLILTFGTFAAPGDAATYDPNILYGMHFDTSMPADGISDLDVYARFAQNESGTWGLQVSGLGAESVEGPVETVFSSNGVKVWAGLADDPFFFDLAGFNETIDRGILSFDNTQDSVAGLNITAIAIEVPIDSIIAGGGEFQSWATTGTL